jgi:hypothetical protein
MAPHQSKNGAGQASFAAGPASVLLDPLSGVGKPVPVLYNNCSLRT